MLDYFFFMFCFLSVIDIKIKGLDNFFDDYMKLENTNSIKGIFVWLIIFCHKRNYGIIKKYLFLNIISNLGQKVVSVFFLYSGFGIYESFKKKGISYIVTLPKKACILFLKFQLILLIYLVTNIFVFDNKIKFKRYFLSAIFKTTIGNSNWFAFNIIMFYIYSYLSFRFVKYTFFIGIIIISFFCFMHSLFVYKYFYPNAKFSVDTVLCFIVGFYYSFIQNYSNKIILKSDIHYFGAVSILLIIYYRIYIENNLIYISIKNALFGIIIIFISMKVRFNNPFLKFLNTHSFSIYLFQRLVMWFTYSKRIFHNSEFFQISFEFTLIFYISSIFDKYTIFIDKFIK